MCWVRGRKQAREDVCAQSAVVPVIKLESREVIARESGVQVQVLLASFTKLGGEASRFTQDFSIDKLFKMENITNTVACAKQKGCSYVQ